MYHNEGIRAYRKGHAFGVRVQRVQKVQRVQRVVVEASPQFLKGRGFRRGLCRRVVVRFAQGATAPAALRVVVSPLGR